MPKQTIDISTSTLIRFISLVLLVIFLYFLKDILWMIFAALILAVAFDRPIEALEKKKVPRFLGVILIYLLVFAAISFLFYLVFPILASQIKNFLVNYSFYMRKIGQLQSKTPLFDIKSFVSPLADKLTASAEAVFGTLVSFFGGVISLITVFVAAIFLNLQEKGVKKFIFYLTPEEHQERVLSLFDKIQKKMGNWFWGKIIGAIILGILVSVGMYLLHVEYALLLGFLAGLLSFIPIIGAFISAVPAVLLALAKSPVLALTVVVYYTIVHSIFENFVLTPYLMKKAVDLNPALVILVVLIGAKIAGIVGVILAVPLAAVVEVLIDEYMRKRERESKVRIETV